MGTDTILITGGGSGIGRAMAERLLAKGHDVIVCGRSEDRLREAREAVPGLRTFAADVSTPEARAALVETALREAPELNVVIHNAGVMRFPNFAGSPAEAFTDEIATNLEAPIHLTSLFLPHLLAQPRATLGFVTSGLAFVPLAATPIYCATKAALHSFSMSLRHQLRETSVGVVEIIPPHVNTDLGTGQNEAGMPLGEFADVAVAGFERRDPEVSVGFSATASRASREELDALFAGRNAPR